MKVLNWFTLAFLGLITVFYMTTDAASGGTAFFAWFVWVLVAGVAFKLIKWVLRMFGFKEDVSSKD